MFLLSHSLLTCFFLHSPSSFSIVFPFFFFSFSLFPFSPISCSSYLLLPFLKKLCFHSLPLSWCRGLFTPLKRKKNLVVSPTERCEEPDCMESENCIVWTSNWAQTRSMSSHLHYLLFTLIFLYHLFWHKIPFALSHFFPPCSNTFPNVLLFSFENVFPLILEVLEKTCSFLLGRIFLFPHFACFLKSLVSFFKPSFQKLFLQLLHVSNYFYLFLVKFSQICKFFACLSFLYAFDQKRKFSFLCFLSVFWTFSFLFSGIFVFHWFPFLVVLFECISFLKILFDLIILFLSLLYLLLLHTFLACQKKHVFLDSFRFCCLFFFSRETNGVFLSPIQHFPFLNVCFASLLPPFDHPRSTCSLFLSLRVFFCLFRHFIFLIFLLLGCLFVFSIYNLSSQLFESL